MLFVIQFLHPAFLYGLFFLAIPILLHLFSLKKYKKVYFSNFNFLASLQQQKKNSSKIKNWLLLFLRLIILSSIVLAFSTPYVNPGHKDQPAVNSQTEIIIYADNSFSMTNTGTQGNLLEEAKKYLFDIVNTYPAGTRFRLLTNEPMTDIPLTRDQIQQMLGRIQICPYSKPLSQILKEAKELAPSSTLFLVSDFQKKNCDFPNMTTDSTQKLVMLMLQPENHNNIFIKEVNFDQAFHQQNQPENIHITLVNASDREYHNVPLSLTINGKKKSIQQTDLKANEEKTIHISYLNTEDGFYEGVAEISDFPVTFDNKFYFSYHINGRSPVLYLWQHQFNPYFGKFFSDSTLFHFTSSSIAHHTNNAFSSYNLVILDDITDYPSGLVSSLEEYLANGGNLLILPGQTSPASTNHFLAKLHAPQLGMTDTSTRIAHIETQSSLFREVFEKEDKTAILPDIHQFYPLASGKNAEKLLIDKRKNTLLAAQTVGKGNLYVSAFSFNPANSDMVFHPLFIPLMANMACRVNTALNTSYFLNSAKPIVINKKNYTDNLPVSIQNNEGDFEFLPEFRKDFSGDLLLANAHNIQDVGLYKVVQGGQTIDILAWNYDRNESWLELCTQEELQKYLPEAHIENIKTTQLNHNSELVKEIVLQDNNKYFTPWLLAIALLALLLEQWVWKKKLN